MTNTETLIAGTFAHRRTIVFGREIADDVYGSHVVFASRADAESATDPALCDEVVALVATDRDGYPVSREAVEFGSPRHLGKNSRMNFKPA